VAQNCPPRVEAAYSCRRQLFRLHLSGFTLDGLGMEGPDVVEAGEELSKDVSILLEVEAPPLPPTKLTELLESDGE
jgi:hypothetical protein